MPECPIRYAREHNMAVAEFVGILQRSGLAERRPTTELETLAGMLKHADLLVTARLPDGLLVGVARAITDWSYCTYLSDLAVDQAWQRQGIGQELIAQTHSAAGLHTALILLAAPAAAGYYPKVGFTQHPSCWWIPRRPVAPTQ